MLYLEEYQQFLNHNGPLIVQITDSKLRGYDPPESFNMVEISYYINNNI